VGERIDVLDHGYVELVDHMGTDSRVPEAARVSTGKGLLDAARDGRLTRRLARDWHTSPFQHVMLTFRLKCPLFVEAQLVRHRVWRYLPGHSQLSQRYTALWDAAGREPECYLPELADIGAQPLGGQNQQGRRPWLAPDDWAMRELARARLVAATAQALDHYRELLARGVARELARLVLPQATYTELMLTGDLWNLAQLVALRAAPDAQYETRVYCEAMLALTVRVAPGAVAALERGLLGDEVTA
jgi:thymidylate synthase (FAD)